jgi:hypothetical protein
LECFVITDFGHLESPSWSPEGKKETRSGVEPGSGFESKQENGKFAMPVF